LHDAIIIGAGHNGLTCAYYLATRGLKVAVLEAAGASFGDVVRVGIYLTDLGNFGAVNEVMKQYFAEPYPARSTIGVAALPLGAAIEIDVIAVLGG